MPTPRTAGSTCAWCAVGAAAVSARNPAGHARHPRPHARGGLVPHAPPHRTIPGGAAAVAPRRRAARAGNERGDRGSGAAQTQGVGGAMRQPVRRSGGQAVRGLALLTLVLSAYPYNRLSAQVPTDTVTPPADTSHRLKPFAAAWRSLLIPGWGQAALGRDVAGAVLASWEGVTIMTTVKARTEVY